MHFRKINDWLQLLAAVAVLAGLLLVVHEIRQNNDLARATTINDLYSGWVDFSKSEYESDILQLLIKSIEEPQDLTSLEQAKLNAYYIALTSLYGRWWAMFLDYDFAYDPTVDTKFTARYYFGSRFARTWFHQNKVWLQDINPEMTEIIGREIESSPPVTRFSLGSGFDRFLEAAE